jgi:hypothetical protein
MRKEATHTTQAATHLKQRKHSIYPPLIEAVLVLALLVFWTVGGLTQ